MKRRDILKWLTIAPLALWAVPLHSFAGSNVFKDSNLFIEIGVSTIINATGKLTYMSGSLMHPDVVKTIREASNYFCMMVIIISLMVHPIFKTASLRFARLSSSRIELTQTHRNNLRSLQGLFMLVCFNKLACSASSQK